MNITEITSTQNNLVKYVVKLQNPKFRKSEKVILLDGEKTIQGIVDDNIIFEYLFLKKDNNLINKIKANNIVIVNDEILKKISTTKTKTDVVGIIKEPEINEKKFISLDKIALIDGIKDAGNLGTIIRSAAAFGIDGIILFNDCVDLYNTKTIRASTQNMFKIPIIHTDNIDFIKNLKKNHKLISTVVNSKNDIKNYKFENKFIVAFGSEAEGLSKDILNITDIELTFKMKNGVESLNLAICASIAFSMI